ncbi:SecDF P1 head subdomain-containing protein [Kribbella monticola]|uniref:SecDF P1 head subdomain-containing protein n=1 Tax=Kribbella monticola TaxID=2185285 RepID=UPI000DD41FBF|nr:hypothetical protein [Kribbella monticola]
MSDSSQSPQYGGPQYGGPQYGGPPPKKGRGALVLVGVLVLVLVVVVAVGAVVLVKGDDHKADSASGRRPAAAGVVEFRRVLKAEAGNCDAAPAGVACDSGGNRYSLGKVELDGGSVTQVKAVAGQNSDWYVNLKLDSAGSRLFGELTADLAQKKPPQNQLAIVVRGRVVSAPTVMSAIPGGDVQIASGFSKSDAEKLAADITG